VSVHLLQRAPRNADLGKLHLTFFVAAIATELCIRTQLYLTHYPQLGGSGLHIAHLLWGGVFMVGALAILLSLLGRRARQVAALLAGVGFGFFIDELGKFITADNDYFYKPAAGLIYLIFIGLYLGSRAYQRHRGLDEDEKVRNAVELIGEATRGPFKQEYRDQALALLADVSPAHPLRAQLIALAEEIDTTPNPEPPWFRRFADAVADRYRAWSEQRWFHAVVIVVFAGWALAGALLVLGLVLSVTFHDNAAHPGFEQDSMLHLNFLNVASLGSTAVSCVLVAIGMARLWRGDRLEAYALFTRALLVSIFVTRVFTFVESQFGATFGLAIDVMMLISIQLMTAQERRQQRSAPPAPRRLAGESAAPAPG
jgi:cation transport ATPase